MHLMFTKCHVYATFDEKNIYNSQWPFEDVQRYMYIRNFEVGSKYLETRDSSTILASKSRCCIWPEANGDEPCRYF